MVLALHVALLLAIPSGAAGQFPCENGLTTKAGAGCDGPLQTSCNSDDCCEGTPNDVLCSTHTCVTPGFIIEAADRTCVKGVCTDARCCKLNPDSCLAKSALVALACPALATTTAKKGPDTAKWSNTAGETSDDMAENCCSSVTEATCSDWDVLLSCESGQYVNQGSKVAEEFQSMCCAAKATCAQWTGTCPAGYELKADPGSIECSGDASTCTGCCQVKAGTCLAASVDCTNVQGKVMGNPGTLTDADTTEGKRAACCVDGFMCSAYDASSDVSGAEGHRYPTTVAVAMGVFAFAASML